MGDPIRIFPLGAVLFPGVSMQLHLFEARYRRMLSDLLAVPEDQRSFAVVAIREGYEVGSHGVRSVQRVGCEARLTRVDERDDDRYDIEVVGRRRLRVDAVDSSGPYLVGEVSWLAEPTGPNVDAEARTTHQVFRGYRTELSRLRGEDVLSGALPSAPVALSYALAATCLLTLPQRQHLLEAADASTRLRLLREQLRLERKAMRAVPSLPASELARTSWSPN